MDAPRFKIDISSSSVFTMGLYVRCAGWLRTTWREIDRYQTREEALAKYEKIKDLPEYLP